MRNGAVLVPALVLLTGVSLGAVEKTSLACAAPAVVATFTVAERFAVAHPDQIIDFDLEKPVDPRQCYLIGPSGREVPYQLLDRGKKLAIRTHLPASRLPVVRGMSLLPKSWNLKDLDNYIAIEGGVSVGDVVRLSGTSLPGGLLARRDYYVVGVKYVDGHGWFAAFAETPGGEPVTLSSNGNDKRMLVVPFAVDLANHRIYAPRHGLHSGDPVVFCSSGTLPAPLKTGAAYRVRNASADAFELSADDTNPADVIKLRDAGDGLHEMHVAWTWTLHTGRAPQPYAEAVKVQENKTDGVWEITNNRLGVRIPISGVPADRVKAPAPVQGVRLAGGTWTATGPSSVVFTPGTQVRKVTVRFVEQGPLKVVAEVSYDLDRVEYRYGQQLVCPAGPGTYTSRIEVQAGQPSVLFEEDTDCQFAYSVSFKGLTLNQAPRHG